MHLLITSEMNVFNAKINWNFISGGEKHSITLKLNSQPFVLSITINLVRIKAIHFHLVLLKCALHVIRYRNRFDIVGTFICS